jgi:hypothetical protein
MEDRKGKDIRGLGTKRHPSRVECKSWTWEELLKLEDNEKMYSGKNQIES